MLNKILPILCIVVLCSCSMLKTKTNINSKNKKYSSSKNQKVSILEPSNVKIIGEGISEEVKRKIRTSNISHLLISKGTITIDPTKTSYIKSMFDLDKFIKVEDNSIFKGNFGKNLKCIAYRQNKVKHYKCIDKEVLDNIGSELDQCTLHGKLSEAGSIEFDSLECNKVESIFYFQERFYYSDKPIEKSKSVEETSSQFYEDNMFKLQ